MATETAEVTIKGDVDTASIRRVEGERYSDDGLIEVPLIGHQYRYHARVDLSGAAPRLIELRLIADDNAEIDPATIRQVPVRRIAHAAAWFIKSAERQRSRPHRNPRPEAQPERSAPRHLDDDHYKRVADLLMEARRIGAKPRKRVAELMGGKKTPVPSATLDRWIAEAKRRGHLRRDWQTTTEVTC